MAGRGEAVKRFLVEEGVGVVNEQQLQSLIAGGETLTVEFKSDREKIGWKKVIRTASVDLLCAYKINGYGY